MAPQTTVALIKSRIDITTVFKFCLGLRRLCARFADKLPSAERHDNYSISEGKSCAKRKPSPGRRFLRPGADFCIANLTLED